jgi:tetratricopeptide (TPR) repeat protein
LAVPLRVSLAAVSNLRSYDKLVRTLTEDPQAVEGLAEVIAMSALEGLDQFYEAFVAFTSKFGYQYEQTCIDLADALGDMFSVSPSSIGRGQQKSACEALANVAQAARRSGNENVWRRLSELGCKYADAILASGEFNSYEARGIAKTFIIAGAADRALEVIDRIPAGEINHWILYRKAEALLTLGLPDALETAQEALAQALRDEKAQKHLSSYYDLLSQCLELRGDLAAALAQAAIAVEHCEIGKYRRALEKRLETVRQMTA